MDKKKIIILTFIFGLSIFLIPNALSAKIQQKSLGDYNAPITITMFTDFECPFCERWHSTTFPQIRDTYIDKGDVRLVIKHFLL
jgi:protein-disulfide isomerase